MSSDIDIRFVFVYLIDILVGPHKYIWLPCLAVIHLVASHFSCVCFSVFLTRAGG